VYQEKSGIPDQYPNLALVTVTSPPGFSEIFLKNCLSRCYSQLLAEEKVDLVSGLANAFQRKRLQQQQMPGGEFSFSPRTF
jgi:hypothetical protein